MQQLVAHTHDPPNPVAIRKTHVAPPLEALHLQSLSKSPSGRPAMAKHLQLRLEALQSTHPWHPT